MSILNSIFTSIFRHLYVIEVGIVISFVGIFVGIFTGIFAVNFPSGNEPQNAPKEHLNWRSFTTKPNAKMKMTATVGERVFQQDNTKFPNRLSSKSYISS